MAAARNSGSSHLRTRSFKSGTFHTAWTPEAVSVCLSTLFTADGALNNRPCERCRREDLAVLQRHPRAIMVLHRGQAYRADRHRYLRFFQPLEQFTYVVVVIGQCLDLTGGSRTNGNQLQTWQCTNGNTNQIWTLGSEL
jgi:hypothetical protein